MAPPRPKTDAPDNAPAQAGVLVVIVNYRTGPLVCDLLDTLKPEAKLVPGLRVVITDNDSGDGSIDDIAAHIKSKRMGKLATTMPLATNGGFAFGNNAAIRAALNETAPPDYLLLLNPDTVIHPGAIESLADFMDANPDVGIAGSRLEHPDGEPQVSAFRFPGFAGELEEAVRFGPVTRLLRRWVVAPAPPEHATPCDWVSGASMMVRREVFDAVGLLDDGYFMYYEELDFTRRAQRAGWPCWYVPDSRVVHLVGQASGVTDIKQRLKRRPRYWFDARRRYFRRHHGVFGKLAIDLGWLAGRLYFKAMNLVRRKPTNDPPHLMRDYVRYCLLPAGGAR